MDDAATAQGIREMLTTTCLSKQHRLPIPYYQDESVTLYNARAEDILPLLEPVDLVLTDPPYGLGEKWQGGTWGADPMYADARRWDSNPVDSNLLNAIIAKGTRAIVWGGNYFGLPPSRCWLAWIKDSLMPTMADFELAWTNFDQPAKLFRARRNQDGKRSHPTQKPLSLMSWCLRLSPESQSVLDPFSGSGTTALACRQLGRKCICIEVEEKHCALTVERLRQAVLPFPTQQPTPPPEQAGLFGETE